MAKLEELRGLSAEELAQKASGLKKELLNLRMQVAGGKLDKPHRIRQIRLEVARLLTLMKEGEGKEKK